ncbi:M20 family metallopeptidase [Chungangia koreensis]|uniref:M20 family metallopeptidase n=1 Tax=Chungangia koreensis TaxID=752657 RepID=A0ABV8X933_9LACT
MEQLFEKLKANYDEMVSIRRYLHMHPELSFQETETGKYIKGFYEALGIPYEGNIGGMNGVVARVKGAKPGKTVALRADFDALPIQEENEVPYKSTVPGVMHACGHDAHTATLLVLAKVLNEIKDQLSGEYVMIHQPAEEYAPGGAKPMIDAGVLEGVDVIFGTHLWSTTPFSTIEYRVGPMMAAPDRFEITIQGKGGHGAMPEQTKDAVVIGSQLVTNLQQIVSRRVSAADTAVVTVASFIADNAFNVIADDAKMTGTVRTFKEEVQGKIKNEMERIIEGTCIAADATYQFDYQYGYPPLVNHEKETLLVKELAATIPGVTEVREAPLVMAGEDFSYYLQNVPGTYFFTGAKPEGEAYPHHHPKFTIDERAMLIAAKTLGSAAINYQHVE